MKPKEFLEEVSKQIKYKPANKPITEELEAHIEDIKNDNLCKGYTENEAEEKAVEQMGDAKQIGKRLNKIHKPKFDWITVAIICILACIDGKFNIILHPESYLNIAYIQPSSTIRLVMIYLVIFLSIFIYFYDYRKICKHSNKIFILATLLNVVAYIRGSSTNGNILYGLLPFTCVSPTTFSVPLYIVAFAGFINEIDKPSKINIITSKGRTINSNILKIIGLSVLSIITSLMINFVSGFLIAMVYLIITTIQLLKRKQLKNIVITWTSSIILFSLLTTLICMVPTIHVYENDGLSSEFWFGVPTENKERIKISREEILKSAKLFGKADLEGKTLVDKNGMTYCDVEDFFGGAMRNGTFKFLDILCDYGWIASISLVSVIMLLNIKLIINAIKMKDTYGKLIMIAIASLYLMQTIGNLAMCLGIGIIAEFTLPFVSSGVGLGSVSFLVNILCISLILSIYRRKNINFEEPKKSKIYVAIENFFFEEVEE